MSIKSYYIEQMDVKKLLTNGKYNKITKNTLDFLYNSW